MKQIRVIIVAVFLVTIFYILHFVSYGVSNTSCAVTGPESSAPLNEQEFKAKLKNAVDIIKKFNNNVICTSVNEEAAKHNLPTFLKSVSLVSPRMNNFLVVFCLDPAACSMCQEQHVTQLCVYMDLGLSGLSLAPGGTNKLDNDYWRLTFGRVFATLSLHSLNVNVLAVDVDAVFLQNPFATGNGISDRPNDIAVVSDVSPFTFEYGSKVSINGGFLYFPGVDPIARQYSKEVLDRIWSKNCEPKKNEQLVTSSVLRYMTRKYRGDTHYHPHMLPNSQYLNFCSTDCGSGEIFNSILSVSDLNEMELKLAGTPSFATCESAARQKWVFFHAACLSKTNPDQLIVARSKGRIQQAMLQWVHGQK